MVKNFIVFFFNFLFILLINYKWRIFVNFFNIYDSPGSRKLHKKKIPLIGGTIIILNFFFVFIVYNILEVQNIYLDLFNVNKIKFLYFIFFIFICSYLVGLYDDKFNLKNDIKTFCNLIIIFSFFLAIPHYEINVIKFSNDYVITVDKISLIFSSLVIVSLITIMNLYDGIDLQAGLFYLLNLIFLFFITKNFILFFLSLSIIFFLVKNYKKKTFLGDSGVAFLTLITAIVYINIYNQENKIVYFDHMILIFFLPILDSIRLFFTRIKKGKSPLTSDNNHFHHLMLLNNNIFIANLKSLTFLLISFCIVILEINTLFGFIINILLYLFLLKNAKVF